MSWISIDVDLDDVYMAMDDRNKKLMAEWLDKEDHLDEYKTTSIDFYEGKLSVLEEEFATKLAKLASKFHSMDNEEIELIENLYKKYC
jgi:hypothetical protein